MTREEIIHGLEFTVAMFLFDPSTGETETKEQLNDMDRITVDACKGAIELLKQNTIDVPCNASNGDMLKLVFPNCVIDNDFGGAVVTNIDGKQFWGRKWWNTPYKREPITIKLEDLNRGSTFCFDGQKYEIVYLGSSRINNVCCINLETEKVVWLDSNIEVEI